MQVTQNLVAFKTEDKRGAHLVKVYLPKGIALV